MKKSKFVAFVLIFALLLVVVSVKPERAYGFGWMEAFGEFIREELPQSFAEAMGEAIADEIAKSFQKSQQNQQNQFGQKKREWWEPSQPTLTSPYQPNQSLPYPQKEEKSWCGRSDKNKNGSEWEFNAIGRGFNGGLEKLCRDYGVNV